MHLLANKTNIYVNLIVLGKMGSSKFTKKNITKFTEYCLIKFDMRVGLNLGKKKNYKIP